MTTALMKWFKNPSQMFGQTITSNLHGANPRNDPFPTAPGMAGNANARGNPESKWRFSGTSPIGPQPKCDFSVANPVVFSRSCRHFGLVFYSSCRVTPFWNGDEANLNESPALTPKNRAHPLHQD